jgi:alkylhydroperoxidase family enzyme
MHKLAQPGTETVRVWPNEVPDAELWRDAGPELERPRWENSRLARIATNPHAYREQMDQVRPMVGADGVQAVRTVRARGSKFGVKSDRVGIMG